MVGKGLFVWFAGSAARARVCVCVCVCVCVRARARVCFGECLILGDLKKKVCKISNPAVIFSSSCIAKCVHVVVCLVNALYPTEQTARAVRHLSAVGRQWLHPLLFRVQRYHVNHVVPES